MTPTSGTRSRRWTWGLIVAVPATVTVLWLATGREVLTKQRKPIEALVHDPVFGDSSLETEWGSGPVFGYFIGLDLVIVTMAASLAIAGVIAWRSRRAAHGGRGSQHGPEI